MKKQIVHLTILLAACVTLSCKNKADDKKLPLPFAFTVDSNQGIEFQLKNYRQQLTSHQATLAKNNTFKEMVLAKAKYLTDDNYPPMDFAYAFQNEEYASDATCIDSVMARVLPRIERRVLLTEERTCLTETQLSKINFYHIVFEKDATTTHPHSDELLNDAVIERSCIAFLRGNMLALTFYRSSLRRKFDLRLMNYDKRLLSVVNIMEKRGCRNSTF